MQCKRRTSVTLLINFRRIQFHNVKIDIYTAECRYNYSIITRCNTVQNTQGFIMIIIHKRILWSSHYSCFSRWPSFSFHFSSTPFTMISVGGCAVPLFFFALITLNARFNFFSTHRSFVIEIHVELYAINAHILIERSFTCFSWNFFASLY